MGSIVNGIALEPAMLKPYGSTFLIFSDYMRPAVRLSALMGVETMWVWTHDSVGLGEDGPTHQPVEHHMALRAIPNLWYVRPGDANETAMAWRIALERRGGPVALALSRQKVPTLDRSEVASADGVLRGAYTLWQSGDGEPDLILLATGSGGPGRARGGADGRRERSRRLDAVLGALRGAAAEYRDEVLPPSVRARVSVEAGVSLGWERWVGDQGDERLDRALRRLGAGNRPVLEQLGITPENVASTRRRCWSAWREGRRRLRPPRREAARAVLGAVPRRATRSSTSASTPTPSGSTTRTTPATSAMTIRRYDAPSAASSSAARASAPRSPPRRSRASARRSATTRTRPTRASSTTT